jgi:hypothetical protein
VSTYGTLQEKAGVRTKVARDWPGIKQTRAPQARRTGNSNTRGNRSTGRISREIGRRIEARSKRPS